MGGKSSKAIITTATEEARVEGTITQLPGKGDASNGDNGIGPVDAPTQDGERGDCTLAEDATADNAAAEPTMARKKSNLIHYVSKKFSFNALKASKKANRKEPLTDAAEGCAETEKTKEEQPPADEVDAEVKPDEVPNGGHDNDNVDNVGDVEVSTEPVVRVSAMSNGFHKETDEEVQYGIDDEKESDVTVPDSGEVSGAGQGLAEKMENLKLDPTMTTPQSNGVAVHATNGEAVTTAASATAIVGDC